MEDTATQNGFFDCARETKDWEKRKAGLTLKFLKTFQHACKHSKAYQEIIRSAGVEPSRIKSLEDMDQLPILRIDDLVARQKQHPPFGKFETMGSENISRIYINPGLIFQPGERAYQDTSWAEALCGAGFKKRDRILNTFNYHLWPLAFMLDESAKMIGAIVTPTGVGNTMMQVKIMQMLKINGFMGTPSFIMTLAQRAEAMGLKVRKDLFLEKALVGAEMLPESLRVRIENKLNMTLRQGYGTVFLGCIGYECQHMTGLHVPDNILVEVIDPRTGKQVETGATGEVVATNFNPLYPMIRMATGDLSMWSQASCPCGRTGPMLKKILGRIDEATKVKGTFVHPWQTDDVISPYPEVYKYQVVITREGHNDIMTFLLELNEDVSRPEILRGRIERDIKNILTIKGVVQIVSRGTIPDFHKKIEDKRSWK
jgi:phenylacetate-CoA ligase